MPMHIISQLLSPASVLFASLLTVVAGTCSSTGDALDDLGLGLRRLAGRVGCSVTAVVARRSMYGRRRARRDRKYSWVAIPALPISESGCKAQTNN